ncbi:hypothetical protein Z517_09999 [Fonsecaea pedrosoi CBS 271.37]|uniref:Uncharacterized protein n=1 Tax=Fonsecaea pedrosoi CBS 271.37 TaxID=1442368 RepID=A0A0D2GA99_9EURO|nr:uncharacterized protein Z517_09999 [Fonsecaea pedrosoi CBS 271.37]KIW77553.1 hypothetical protein Z517_09999 [Fonsecaea pedrosoi CBS 271.37]
MDEKEKELIATTSGSLGFASLRLPFGRADTSSSIENRSINIDRSSLETFGGARTFTSVAEWEQSLNDPMTWGVIEREQPQKLFDVIAQLPGWEWVLETVDTIANSAPILAPLPAVSRSRYFSEDTSIAGVVSEDTTFLFFQDHDGWIRWGMYTLGSSAECVFPEPIVQAQPSTPLAGCIYEKSFCSGDGSLDDRNSDHGNPDDDISIYKQIHLFYINETGVMADQIITISLTEFDGELYPELKSPWTPGTIHELGLEIPLATKFAASCSYNNDSAIVVVFEQPSLSKSSSSHIVEAMRRRNEPWKVLPRPAHHLEGVPGGPLHVTYSDSAYFAILYQSATTGELSWCLADPNLENPYLVKATLMPPSHLPDDEANGSGGMRICFGANLRAYDESLYVAMRDEDNTVDVRHWIFEEDAGRSIRTLHKICATRPRTNFCLIRVRKKSLLIVYITPDGQMELALLNASGPPLPAAKIPRWSIFQDSCARSMQGLAFDDDDDDDDDDEFEG